MNKLFIIGNGFDLAHGLKTSYNDFRLYLISLLHEYNEKYNTDFNFSDNSIIEDIISTEFELSEEKEFLVILYFLTQAENQQQWQEIEKSVGELNFDCLDDLFIDWGKDEFATNEANEDIVQPYIRTLLKIPDFFERWISEIKIEDAKMNKGICQKFDENTLFLSFNYTSTLEEIYNINEQKVLHIHGCVKNNNKLFFGHGEKYNREHYLQSLNINSISVADAYSTLNYSLRKPVDKILEQNKNFFESLGNINEVYSYGFSYSDIDLPYIKAICKNIPKSAKQFIHSYPPESKKNECKNKIKACGYQGEIKEFNNKEKINKL